MKVLYNLSDTHTVYQPRAELCTRNSDVMQVIFTKLRL